MISTNLSANMTEALARAALQPGGRPGEAAAFTIALSREAGAGGTSVARALGTRLGWCVYDHELVDQVARDANVRAELLRRLEERPNSFLEECVEAFADTPTLSEPAYARRVSLLIQSLGAAGNCIIVGRGGAHILHPETTLRVRLLAEREDRIRVLGRELKLPREEAARRLDEMDRQRIRFIRENFQKDPTDPQNYDMVLSSSRFSVEQCADLILKALDYLRAKR